MTLPDSPKFPDVAWQGSTWWSTLLVNSICQAVIKIFVIWVFIWWISHSLSKFVPDPLCQRDNTNVWGVIRILVCFWIQVYCKGSWLWFKNDCIIEICRSSLDQSSGECYLTMNLIEMLMTSWLLLNVLSVLKFLSCGVLGCGYCHFQCVNISIQLQQISIASEWWCYCRVDHTQ